MRTEYIAWFRLGTALAALLVLPFAATESSARAEKQLTNKQAPQSRAKQNFSQATPQRRDTRRAAAPYDECRWRNIPVLRWSCPHWNSAAAPGAAFGSTNPGPAPGPGPGPGPGVGPGPALGNPGNAMNVGRAGEGPPNDSRTAEFGFNPGPGVQGMSDSPGGAGSSGSAGGPGAGASAGNSGGQGGGNGGASGR
jgi:hypothetical protein